MQEPQAKPSPTALASGAILELKRELVRQWEYSHGELCGVYHSPWSHPGVCYWLFPYLQALSASEAQVIWAEAQEEPPF